MDRLKQAITTSARTGKHNAVMFLDLDHFKLLNDSQGHDEQPLHDLMKKTDWAMYQGKSTERNTARFFDPAMQERHCSHHPGSGPQPETDSDC